jgi:hypothetical protein
MSGCAYLPIDDFVARETARLQLAKARVAGNFSLRPDLREHAFNVATHVVLWENGSVVLLNNNVIVVLHVSSATTIDKVICDLKLCGNVTKNYTTMFISMYFNDVQTIKSAEKHGVVAVARSFTPTQANEA